MAATQTKKISRLIKESIEKQVVERMQKSTSLIVVGYSGLSAPDFSALRMKLESHKIDLLVAKNSLSKRIFKQKKLTNLEESVEGPTGIIFVEDEPVTVSKILVEFGKTHEALKVRAGIMNDKVLTKSDIETLSKLPSRDVLIAKVVGGIKAPLNNLYGVLSQLLRKPLLVLKAIADKKQAQS